MSQHQNKQAAIERTHNTARFFTETRQVAWVLLIGTMLWGVYGWLRGDWAIVVANAITGSLCIAILVEKIRNDTLKKN